MSLGVIAAHDVQGGATSYSAAVLADVPILYQKLDETAGPTAADSSGNNRTATYTNTPTIGAASLLTDGSGHSMAVAANSGQCTTIPSATWMDVTRLSVEAIINLSSAVDASNGDALVSRYTSAGFTWLLWRNTTGKLALQILLAAGGGTWNCAGATTLPLTTKLHVVGTYDGTNMRVYLNGAQDGVTAATGSIGVGAAPLEVGRYSAGASTTPGATFDEVAVFDHALSAARVSAHFALV